MSFNAISSFLKRVYYKFYTWVAKDGFFHMGEGALLEIPHSLQGENSISIGRFTRIQKGSTLTAWNANGKTKTCLIQIGENCCIGAFNHITAINKIEIGDNFLSGKWVTITDNSHGDTSLKNLKIAPQKRKIISKGGVVIGNNVWIGDKVTILPNVKIGDGAVIAANAVVTNNVPAYSVACGVPAKIVKRYEIGEC